MSLTRRARAACLATVAMFAAAAAGCDDFYSDSTPFNTGPTATRSADGPSDPAAAIEQAARTALVARLGVAPETPRLISMTGVTWSASDHGCFPFETSAGSAQLVPGISAFLEYENFVYQYDADQAGTIGALCESARRDVPVSSASSIFDTDPFLPPAPVILRTADEAETYLTENPGAAFDVELIDWPVESLGAAAIDLTDLSVEPLVRGARLYEDGRTVIVELTAFETGKPQPGTYPLWVFLEDIGDAEAVEAEIAVEQMLEPTPTPPPFNLP